MDYEDRTTLDRLVELLDDRGLALSVWNLAMDRAHACHSHSLSLHRLYGLIETLAALTRQSGSMVARDLGVFRLLDDGGIDVEG